MAIKFGDLVNTDGTPATKNGVQTVYKINGAPIVNSPQIIYSGNTLKPVTVFSSAPTRNMECIISGTSVEVGLAPKSTDVLWAIWDE